MGAEGGRILVVDDNKINRMVLVRGLTGQGHTVATAENGRQGLDLLRARPFDVVLLDILMPELDGYATLALIKDDASLRHIPVIMISAVDEMDSVIRCIGMGAADYLPKPFNAALLEARINASLATKKLRDLELEYIAQAGTVADAAAAVELGAFEPQSLAGVAGRPNALGRLARVFLRMAEEVHLREQRLRRQLERLHLDMEEMRRVGAQTLDVYLPMDRRQALVRGEGLPDRTTGAALFADLSGSTPLAEALANELGLQRGAEEISRQLNRVFSALIDEVERYGGSVISFAGDAITCWFDGDDGLRATASALAMQDAMAQFAVVTTPTGTVVSLGIKAAVAVGPVRRFLVGDAAIQQIEILAGRTLETLASGEHLAGRGEVIVQAEVSERAPLTTIVREWRVDPHTGQRFASVAGVTEPVPAAPWPDLGIDALTPERCRPWVLPAVFEIARSGGSPFLAELRPVASLFLQFQGIDYDNDDKALTKLDAYVRWVQGVVTGHDGCLLRVSDGDKGSTLHAAFGTPTAHEDDAERAVSAAFELYRTPTELGFVSGVRVGVAQGLMWTGAYGGRRRREYGVLGDKANLAARLMQAAADGILCDEAVYRGARSRYAFEALPPIAVKGKDGPIRVYRPTRRPAQGNAGAGAVGRTAERAALSEALEGVRRGKSRTVMIEGEAGMGRSWLVAGLRRQAEAANVSVLAGTATAGASSGPYHAWRGVFGQLLDLSGEMSVFECDQRIREILRDRPDLLGLAPLLSPVLPCSIPDNDITALLSVEERTDEARRTLTGLLQQAVAQRPLIIVLDDAHHMDSASWQLALDISRRVSPVLLVLAMHPIAEPVPRPAKALTASPDIVHIRLSPLSPGEVRAVVCEYLGVTSVQECALRLIVDRCEGHPFLCVELTRALVDERYLVVEGGECRIRPDRDLQDAALPTTVQGIVSSRLDRLSPCERLALKVASVVGRTFGHQILHDIFPAADERPRLHQILEGLEAADLLETGRSSPTLEYSFRSTSTWEATYGTLLFAQRRQLHRAVAEWYERAYSDNLPDYYPILAHHWRRADDPAKAIDYLERAGQDAARRGALEQAESFLKESLELSARSAVLSGGFYDESG